MKSLTSNRFQRLFGAILTVSVIALTLCISPSAKAQLTTEDIEQLQEQIKKEGWSFTVGDNPACRYSIDQLTGLIRPRNWDKSVRWDPVTPLSNMPDSFDWRNYGGCSPIKNQGGCGSCWAFGTVGILESAILLKDGVLTDLSEQFLVSCATDFNGCDGGWYAHDYHAWQPDPCGDVGAVMEAEFPYAEDDLPCGCPYSHPYTIQSWALIGDGGTPSVEEVKQALLDWGPVAVTVYASSPMQGYTGGVFDACGSDGTNHIVCIVGWDDNQGIDGVWFMRNSWGPGWGEGGYMRIPYNCADIAFDASYVDYKGPFGVFIETDVSCGEVPLDVSFTGWSALTVGDWSWTFGDGETADIQAPAHTYDEAGVYTVSVECTEGQTVRSLTKPNAIVVHADTMKAAVVSGDPGEEVAVDITLNNIMPVDTLRIPLEFGGDVMLNFDSLSTVGCRTELFDRVDLLHYDPYHSRMTIRVDRSASNPAPDMPPGSGSVVRVYFRINAFSTPGESNSLSLAGYSGYLPRVSGPYATYFTPTVGGSISVNASSCCQIRGDFNHDGIVDVSDIVNWVSWAFDIPAGPGPECVEEGPYYAEIDVNNDGVVDVSDLVYWVEWSFSSPSGPDPVPCD